MTRKLFALAFCLMFISVNAKATIDRDVNPGNKRVLLVSFIDKNFFTTYENSVVAETNKISESEILPTFDEKIASIFENSSENGIEFVGFENKSDAIFDVVFFNYNEKENMVANLSELPIEQFNALLDKNSVDYVIFINFYQMKWIGDPQFKLDNEIHYSIIGRDKKSLLNDRYTFSTPKLVPLTKMEKKYQKAVAKICDKFLKNS